MSDIVEDVLSCTDDILGLRDDLGAVKHKVYIYTKTWSGSRLGQGTFTQNKVQILPTPHIVDYSHSLRVREGGKIKEGDIILRSLSKQKYPNESQIDLSVTGRNIEKYYLIDGFQYQLVDVVSKYVTWSVHIRKTSSVKITNVNDIPDV